jgi:hypothetical protein
MAPPSPLLADPAWIEFFRWMIEKLSTTARDLKRFEGMPSYCDMLLHMEWRPNFEALRRHLYEAVEDGRKGPEGLSRSYTMDPDVWRAYQLACAMMDDVDDKVRANPDAIPIPGTVLEGVREMLARSRAANASSPVRADTGGSNPTRSDPDPLEATLALISHSPQARRLIEFVYTQPKWTTKAEEACRHVYRAADKKALANLRRLVDRNDRILEKRDTPLRILRDKETREIKLVSRDGPPTT